MKRQHPYYYKLERAAKTAQLLSTILILNPKFAKKIKGLVDELDAAMRCNEVAKSLYEKKDLLKD